MCGANLVGFVLGLEGMRDLLSGIWRSWHGPFHPPFLAPSQTPPTSLFFNRVGLVGGPDSDASVRSLNPTYLISTDHPPHPSRSGVAVGALSTAGVFAAVQLMIEYREDERRHGVFRKY
jgi:hypothetical protein